MVRTRKSAATADDGDDDENRSRSSKATQRRHVIDDTGEACLKTVDDTGDIDVTCPVPVTTVEITETIFRCKRGKGTCRDRIAHEKEKVQYIWNGSNAHVWIKTESRHESRNGILHRRPREVITGQSREVGTSVLEIRAQKLGVFGPKGSQTDCFFLPFGLVKDSREPTGVWVSIRYYTENLIPKVVSLGYDANKCKGVINQLLHSGRFYEDEEEDEEDEEMEVTGLKENEEEEREEERTEPLLEALPETQPPEPLQPVQQFFFQQVMFVPFMFPPPQQPLSQQSKDLFWCLTWYLPDIQ